MTEEIPPQVIKQTQTLLGKYIKEPPLTDKLLKKPPFRFIQDIVKSIVKETGFLSDVFSAEELSENIKDKEGKVAFLKKLINATQNATGSTITARPSRIAAGLEVSKTLELFQFVATGVALKQSGAVVKPPAPAVEEKKVKKKSKEKDASKDPTKKSKSKSESDGNKDENSKEKKKKKDKDLEDTDKIIINGDRKRDKSAKEAVEGKKRDKSAKEGSSEDKKVEQISRDEQSTDKKRKKSAKDNESGDQKMDQASNENGLDKRDKSAKKEKPKERPSSRRPSLDGVKEESKPEIAPNVQPVVNGIGDVHESDTKEEAAPATAKVLDNVQENVEPTMPNASRKLSIDASNEKPDKENRIKRDKRDRSKEGSAVERKTSSRRSSSKVRPSSKNAEKSEKVLKEKKPGEEPTVLGSGEAPVVPVPQLERPQTARKPPPSARPQSVRPPSARPGAPKIRDRGEVKTDIEPEAEVKVVPVITDSEKTNDDENTVTVERQTLTPDLDQGDNIIDAVNKVGDNEGALVAQILETKKELEDAGQVIGAESQRNVEIEWEGGKKQKKEAWGREINKLREGIQQLTRSTNPLGKLFDFLQEDVDSMQRELKSWKETNSTYSKQLQSERRMAENSLETYRRQLSELDSLIEQETETLKNMKANVLANDRKIYSLITKTSIE